MSLFPIIDSKLPGTGTTIFTIMSGLASAYDAINLSQGFPGYPTSPQLLDLINYYAQEGKNQYAPMAGILPLRESIVDKIEQLYNNRYNVDHEVTLTAGATEAIWCAIATLIHPGDEVVIFEPAFDSYAQAVRFHGGVCVFVPLIENTNSVDWELVQQAITSKTKLILVNTPHNPSGAVWTQEDWDQLSELVVNTSAWILSDEVYEHIVFDENKHVSGIQQHRLLDRLIAVFSFGKTYNITGWRAGYVVAPELFMTEFRKVHQFVTFSINTPLQYALADFMQVQEEYLKLKNQVQRGRDVFIEQLAPVLPIRPTSGGYFQLISFEGIVSDANDRALALRLVKEAGVAAIPLSPFYHDHYDTLTLRFCIAKQESELVASAAKIKAFLLR